MHLEYFRALYLHIFVNIIQKRIITVKNFLELFLRLGKNTLKCAIDKLDSIVLEKDIRAI